MKRYSLYISVLLVLAMAGCQKDVQVEEPSAFVRFNPTIAPAEAQTKTRTGESVTEGVLATEDGTFSIPVSCEESEGIFSGAAVDEPATKGSLINGDGSGAVAFDTGETFFVTAWDNAATPARIIPAASSSSTSEAVSYSSSEWTTATEYKWEKNAVMTFYAYANLPSATGAASVSNTSASSQTLTYDLTKAATASAQTDILLGYYKGDSKSGSPAEMTGTASIEFSHPLSAVRFKLGTVKGVTTFAVNSISIEGVYASGTASMTASSSGGIEWSTVSGSTTVSQTVSTQPTSSAPQIGEAFLLIPQSFASTSTARMVLNCKIDGTDRVLYYPLASTQWKTGYCYTYTIGFDGRAYSYTFSPNKTQLSFTNTTTASSPAAVEISSKSVLTGDDASDTDWFIRSVKVGSADAVPVGAASFTNIGGLSASKDGGNLKVTALARTPLDRGSNDYWTNKDGISGDKTGIGWSPKDWSTTKATSTAPLDLSKFDFQTEQTTTTMTTANCYVIRHAGTYKIPLVYGNAIKGGAANTDAYNPTIASGGTNDLKPFLNHLGYGIISPFIEYNTSNGKAKDSYNSYLAPASASIVWQDKNSIITSVSLSTSKETVRVGSTDYSISYLIFTIPQDKICENNAVIAVKDGSGNIMWSWHIWTTNDPALLDGPISVTNRTPKEYEFFPLFNIGWIYGYEYPELDQVVITLEQKYSGKTTSITVKQPEMPGGNPSGVYYQWGRKDPMRSANVNIASGSASIQTAIQNPQNFYLGTSAESTWCSSHYFNLWTGGYSFASNDDQNSNMIKTVYDPSPVGYKVPASKAFSGFTTVDGNATQESELNFDTAAGFSKGLYFYTQPNGQGGKIFFPASGYRYHLDGNVSGVGSFGTYWTANHNVGKIHYLLYFSNGASGISVYYNNAYASIYGCSVRPVKE